MVTACFAIANPFLNNPRDTNRLFTWGSSARMSIVPTVKAMISFHAFSMNLPPLLLDRWIPPD
jgi:hypothetical protein